MEENKVKTSAAASKCGCSKDADTDMPVSEEQVEAATDLVNPDIDSMESRG